MIPIIGKYLKDASCQVCTYSCRQKADVQASDIMLVNRNGQLGTFFKVNGEEYAVSAPGEFLFIMQWRQSPYADTMVLIRRLSEKH